MSEQIEETLEETFKLNVLVINFVNILIGYLISIVIKEPLLSLANYFRTWEWTYELNPINFALFLSIVSGIIFFFYLIVKPVRKDVHEVFEKEKSIFYQRIISIIFALLVVDAFTGIAYYFSSLPFAGKDADIANLGYIIDQIVAALILLFILIGIYGIWRIHDIKRYDWFESSSVNCVTQRIENTFQETFRIKTLLINFIDILIAYLISTIILSPLLSLAQYIRTWEWTYELNILKFVIFIGIVSGCILIVMSSLKPIKKDFYQEIYQEFIEKKGVFYQRIISIIFALLVTDIFIEIAIFLSLYSFDKTAILDIFVIVDNIISSLILLNSFLIVYGIYKKIKNKRDENIFS